jgi:hypothetical protein
MSARVVASITYAGTLLSDLMTTPPWACVGAQFPDSGGVQDKPQFTLDVLEPVNVDGVRYRVGGAHFPRFRVRTVVACSSFVSAKTVAREHDLCKGEPISLSVSEPGSADAPSTAFMCYVLDVRAIANASRVLGASAVVAGSGGVPGGGASDTAALASVDTEWTLQVAPL